MSETSGFEGFAAARAGALFRTAWLLTGDWQLAEDLVQETLARVYVHWRKVSRMDNPAAYTRKVLVNAHLSHRRLRRNSELPSAGVLTDRGAVVAADDPGLRLTLLDGLGRLEPIERAVLVLRYWEDLDVATTARLLDLSAANVRTRSVRALDRLRVVLGTGLDDVDDGDDVDDVDDVDDLTVRPADGPSATTRRGKR
jgi:RNA polymerase sigma-70 factor (sigma-E family)